MGSIEGPILWNFLLVAQIKPMEERDDFCQADAVMDDVFVFDGDKALEVEQRANVSPDQKKSVERQETKQNRAPVLH